VAVKTFRDARKLAETYSRLIFLKMNS